ncbi:MAG: transcriptional regulator [Magnetospirillum sp.]|nr:transcriptional regulator [Magnetospirillum sp.]
MPRTIRLVLEDDIASRLDAHLAAHGGDEAALLERALRAFLEVEAETAAARAAVIQAAGEGEFGAAPGLSASHEKVRAWLLGWGKDDESNPPGSC